MPSTPHAPIHAALAAPAAPPAAPAAPAAALEALAAPADDGAAAADTRGEIYMVVMFNHESRVVYTKPAAEGGSVLLVDVSASIEGDNAVLLRTAVAAFTQGTAAHGAFNISKPGGSTAIIGAVQHALAEAPHNTLYVLTDGEENCFAGQFDLGTHPDGSANAPHVSFADGPLPDGAVRGTPALLADYLEQRGIKICVLGIGAAAQPMVKEMVGRRNVYLAHVSNGADTKQVVSTVYTLKKITRGNASNAFSVTRNGTQHAVLTCLSREVAQAIQQMTPQQEKEYDALVAQHRIEGMVATTPSDLKHDIDQVLTTYTGGLGAQGFHKLTDDELRTIKAALLLGMEIMATKGATPGALLTGKHCACIHLPKRIRQHINRLLSRLAKAGVLVRAENVGEAGKTVMVNDTAYRFTAGCAQYTTQVPLSAVQITAQDEEYCTLRNQLTKTTPKKRKRSANAANAANKKSRGSVSP